ncbi:MAG: hypothetical protein KDD69_00490 [Bdellovibrionales bacterium]|nr:hypothetical protein [Bdellovibrionales bacterium]
MGHGYASLITAGAARVALPLLAVRSAINPAWREAFAERTLKEGWAATLPLHPVWLHGASMGEITALGPVIRRVATECGEQQLLVTATSKTGRAKAVELVGEQGTALLFPFDHPKYWDLVFERMRPRLVIVSETELWPNFLFALRRRRIPAVLINGRISDYSIRNYRRLKPLLAPALQAFDRVLVQSTIDAERFASLGVDAGRIAVTGSTKYDQQQTEPTEDELMRYAAELGLRREAPCFVAGSVRPGEDVQVLEAYRAALDVVPDLQLVFAPRHPERFDAAAELLQSFGFQFHRRSSGAATESRSVVLLDTLGELRRAYGLASVAFIGASLVDIGGHNPLEPAAYGVPVVAGPYMSTVRDAVQMLRREGAFSEVTDAATLTEVLCSFCRDSHLRARAGAAARRVWLANVGATDRVMTVLLPFLRESRIVEG